jgi:uncharacterized protein with beta-barrel porin domain
VQTTAYTLSTANNPITFGTGTNIDAGNADAVDAGASATWNVTNEGTLRGEYGIRFGTTPATVTNSGAINGFDGSISFLGGGAVNNQAGGILTGEVFGLLGPVIITNAGTINEGTGGFTAVYLRDGGQLNNLSGGSINGGIGFTGSLTNQAGATITSSTNAIDLKGSITNGGRIVSTSVYGEAVSVSNGSAINQAGGVILGGLGLVGGATVSNSGSITGTNGPGVYLTAGSLDNQVGGSVSGTYVGVRFSIASGNVTNAGSITASGGAAVSMTSGGVVDNQSGGNIYGETGLYIGGGPARVTNAGAITGTTASIKFGGTGANVLTLQTGSTLSGAAIGSTASGATNALILQGFGEADNNFLNFNTLNMGGTGTWTLAGTSTFGTTEISSGTLVVAGAVTSTFTIDPGATLQGGTANLFAQGEVTDNGVLVFDQPDDGLFANDIAGAGAIIKEGAGNLTLSGASAVTSTVVAGGALTVTGSLRGIASGVEFTQANGLLSNSGAITATSGIAVQLDGGGDIANTGAITGLTGVYVKGGAGTVTNAGSISGAAGVGVALMAGGSVTNKPGASITGGQFGVYLAAGGSVANSGSVYSSVPSFGFGPQPAAIALAAGGDVTNAQSGRITSSGVGIYIQGASGAVVNDGAILGALGRGIELAAGGSVTNNATGTVLSNGTGVLISGGQGVVTNAGYISGGVRLGVGGSVTNQTGGYISGGSHSAVALAGAGSVTNSGVITADGSLVAGVLMQDGGNLTNAAGAIVRVQGLGSVGVYISGAAASVTNSGTITSLDAVGVLLAHGGSVANGVTGNISGAGAGVYVNGSAGTVTNAGFIGGASAIDGVALAMGGSVTNDAKALIYGAVAGVYVAAGGSVTNAGMISGADSVVFSGSGANSLILQTGSTLIGDAVGSAAAGATKALILQGGGLAANNFVGFQTLNVQGPGVWTLNGVSSIDTTEVAAGELAVGDAAHASAVLTSTVGVDEGATLSGHGTIVGAVTNNGTVAPGGSIGVLTINGDYVQTSSGVLVIAAMSATASKLVVTGAATLAGVVQVDEGSGFYRKGSVFDVLSAGSINGGFSSVVSGGPGDFSLSTQGGTVSVVAEQGSLAPVRGGQNVSAVAGAVNNYAAGLNPDFDVIADTIGALGPGPAQNAALAQLGSEVDADLVTAGRESVLGLFGQIGDQLDKRGVIPHGAAAGAAGGSDPMWLTGFGRFASVGGDGDAHGFSSSAGGVSGGLQRDWGDTTLGAAISYDKTSLDLRGLPQNGDLATTSGALYAEARWGAVFADLEGVLGYDRGDLKRSVLLPGVARNAGAAFDGLSGGVALTIGDRIATRSGWLIEPTASLTRSRVEQDAFSESGAGGADLVFAPLHQDFTEGRLGARLAKTVELSSGALGVDATLAWSHQFQSLAPIAAESFAGVPGTGFAISGVDPGRDAGLVHTGLTYTMSRVSLFASYDGDFSDRETQSAVSGGVRIAW